MDAMPHRPSNDKSDGDAELHATPPPIHEDYRYMIRATYEATKDLKAIASDLVHTKHTHNTRIDRLEQSHKSTTWWGRAIGATAVGGILTAIWTALKTGSLPSH